MPVVTNAPEAFISISELLLVSYCSVVRLTLPLASRLNEPTTDFVPAALFGSVKTQFSPENEADLAMLRSWFCSSLISFWILLLSTPGSLAVTSFFLISSTTSLEFSMADEATSVLAAPRPRAS
ncbi:hypothetical protein ASD63_08905 [Ensifer sp. Root558]|nr:hypothetical protein ASD63_08905 [Ensifer sp. Root558]